VNDSNNTNQNVERPVEEPGEIRPEEETPQPSSEGKDSFRTSVRKFFAGMSRERRPVVQRDPKQDRTRPLLLLIGGIVGSVLLFVGVFSTPPSRKPMDHDREEPNLGNRGVAAVERTPSVTPLLNAQIQSDEAGRGRLRASDIENTSQRQMNELSGESDLDRAAERESLASNSTSNRRPSPVPRPMVVSVKDEVAPAPEVALAAPQPEPNFPFSQKRNTPPASLNVSASAAKSSIIYVRAAPSSTRAGNPKLSIQTASTSLLAPGSRLIARLESAVSSALQAPVIASVEYNYERNGEILVPAGTKVIGELQQASANGLVGIAFHSLRMPDGRTEPIQAVAMDLKSEPLKGTITGTNKGRKLLTRALSGVGTIAAYAVGGSGGLSQTITGGTLLRDRVAGNIAAAGEQELTNAAITQNIVVTVPAQTRIYVVLQKPAIEAPATAIGTLAPTLASPGVPMPTVQEIRELMELRQEINRMYRDAGIAPESIAP